MYIKKFNTFHIHELYHTEKGENTGKLINDDFKSYLEAIKSIASDFGVTLFVFIRR